MFGFALEILGWREVPVDQSQVGAIAAQTEPEVRQIFVGKGESELSEQEFNTKLYIARKVAEHQIQASKLSQANYFYLPSFSTIPTAYS